MNAYLAQMAQQEKLEWLQAIGASLGLIVAALFLPGGDDLYRYYIPFELGCLDCGFVPYFAQWFLAPLRFLPAHPYGWVLWTIISVLGFLILAYFTGANPILFMISFPVLGQIWLGQIDVLICAGIIIYLSGKNPYWRGLGVILALTKPQLTALPLLFSMLLETRASVPKLFVVPSGVVLASLLVYGFAWPAQWLSNAMTELPVHAWRQASLDIWRYGVFLLPIPLFMDTPRRRLEAGLLVSALATPFFGVYSYVIFLLLRTKWWWTALSFAWLVGLLWLGESAMRLAWILPMGMLASLVFEAWQERAGKSAKGNICV
jgi:hypothetical protein